MCISLETVVTVVHYCIITLLFQVLQTLLIPVQTWETIIIVLAFSAKLLVVFTVLRSSFSPAFIVHMLLINR